MLTPIDGLAGGVIGVRAVGRLTIDDYKAVVEPVMGRVTAVRDLRLLLHLGPEFTGFGEGAWGRVTDELRHTRFHKGAVVTDVGHIRMELNVLKWLLHGDVRTFRNVEYDRAVYWVTS